MGKKVRSTVTGLLGVSMAFGTVSGVQAQSVKDISGHWAEQKIQKWLDEDNLKGYQDGSFKPNQTITRAEFVAMINRLFGYTETAEIDFKDLNAQNWAYKDIAAAVKAGYVKGYGNQTIRPGAPITRQEAAVIVAKILGVNPIDSGILKQFTDAEQIAGWGKSGVTVAVENEVMKGYPNHTFSPSKALTRAEAVSLIDAALTKKDSLSTTTYDKEGTYGPAEGTEVINGSIVISAPGVVLQNVEIKGNLTLAEGIGEGDVTIKNVKVHGTTNVQGGGVNSIHFVDSVLVNVIVNKKDGTVRIVAEGSTSAESVVVQSSVKLEESGVSGVGFTDVELAAELPANAQVVLNGTFDDVDISAASISVQLQRGSIENLNISDVAKNTSVNLSSGTSVTKLILDAIAKLLGSGTIKTAVINEGGQGSVFTNRPTNVEGPRKDKITVTTPPIVSGGGGGASSGGDAGTNPTPPSADQTAANAVIAKINALPAVEQLTLADEVQVNLAMQAYEALTDGQKALISASSVQKLNQAVAKISELKALSPDTKINKVEEDDLLDGEVSFTWSSSNGIGSKDKLENTSGSSYEYYSDGAYLALQLKNSQGEVLNFSDVFEQVTLQTNDGTVDKIPDSNREKADFGGFEGLDSYKTVLAQPEGGKSLFYGVRQSKGVAHTVGFKADTSRKVTFTVNPKEGALVDDYTITIYTAQQGTGFNPQGEALEYKVEVKQVPNQDQDAPTQLAATGVTVAGNDGTITGVNEEMEYRQKNFDDEWTQVTGTTITGLRAGTYEVRYAAKDGYNAGASAEVVVAPYAAPDTKIAKVESDDLLDGEVSFTWSSSNGIGSKDKLENTSGSSYDYYSDGAYLALQLKNSQGEVLNFSEVFEQVTLQTNDGTVDKIPDSNREKADFGGFEGFESYKTVLAQPEGGKSLFYGLRQTKGVAHTVGFAAGTERTIHFTVTPKESALVDDYTITIYTAQQGIGFHPQGEEALEYQVKVKEATNQDQEAPTGLMAIAATAAGNDGIIIGVTAEMEYRLKSSEDEWSRVTGAAITGLSAGTYEVRYAAKDGYNVGASAEVVVVAYEAPDTSITKVEEDDLSDGAVSFKWSSMNGIGNKDKLVNTSGSSYEYYSDGAYLALQLKNNQGEVLNFSEVFEQVTLQTNDGTVDKIPDSNREKADFGGFEGFESYKTVLAQPEGGKSLFYGLRQTKGVAHTVGFEADTERTIHFTVKPKEGAHVGEYTITVYTAQQGTEFNPQGEALEYKVEVKQATNQDQEAPTGLKATGVTVAGNDGTITDVTEEMEYRLKDSTDWIKVTGTTITGLSAGTYEVRYAAKDGYNEGASAEVIVAPYAAPDTKIAKVESDDLLDGEVSFTWSSSNGIGSKDKLENTSGSSYEYYSDGAYLALQLKNSQGEVLNFSEVFEKITLQTDGGKVDTIPDSNREKADFGGFEGFESSKTVLAQPEGGKSLFYGLRQSSGVAHTVGFEAGKLRSIHLTVTPKSDLPAGEYTITIYTAQQGTGFNPLGEALVYKVEIVAKDIEQP